jgi:hypothetical protein
MKLQLPRWRGAVDALTQTDEGHADMIQVFEHRHEVPQVAPESIQSPAHEHVEASPLGVLQQASRAGVCPSHH